MLYEVITGLRPGPDLRPGALLGHWLHGPPQTDVGPDFGPAPHRAGETATRYFHFGAIATERFALLLDHMRSRRPRVV